MKEDQDQEKLDELNQVAEEDYQARQRDRARDILAEMAQGSKEDPIWYNESQEK